MLTKHSVYEDCQDILFGRMRCIAQTFQQQSVFLSFGLTGLEALNKKAFTQTLEGGGGGGVNRIHHPSDFRHNLSDWHDIWHIY